MKQSNQKVVQWEEKCLLPGPLKVHLKSDILLRILDKRDGWKQIERHDPIIILLHCSSNSVLYNSKTKYTEKLGDNSSKGKSKTQFLFDALSKDHSLYKSIHLQSHIQTARPQLSILQRKGTNDLKARAFRRAICRILWSLLDNDTRSTAFTFCVIHVIIQYLTSLL